MILQNNQTDLVLVPAGQLKPLDTICGFQVRPGFFLDFGATVIPGGVNFTIQSHKATSCELLLFHREAEEPFAVLPFPDNYRIGFCYSMIVFGLDIEEFEYAYRLDGPYDEKKGLRFDRTKILLDPYARAVTGQSHWGHKNNPQHGYRARVVHSNFDWGQQRHTSIPMEDLIIYELHVRGYTKDASSGVKHPGTFDGLKEKIPYLKGLGVNAVELMPVFEFDEMRDARLIDENLLLDFWGYNPVSFFAPNTSYSSSKEYNREGMELKSLIKELHDQNMEVILDVVFNHTAEGNEFGPSFSFKGFDNQIYYMLTPDGHYYNFSGCGNTLNCNHPVVQNMILDCLRYWVIEYRVDGFRFDLASILGRNEDGTPLHQPPLLRSLAFDSILGNVKLIAEAWDAGGLYQVGSFPSWKRWAEWNGRYRDDMRRFLKGDDFLSQAAARRITGSPDLYDPVFRGRNASVNFLTCHDGFTLYDLYSYNEKHNEANGCICISGIRRGCSTASRSLRSRPCTRWPRRSSTTRRRPCAKGCSVSAGRCWMNKAAQGRRGSSGWCGQKGCTTPSSSRRSTTGSSPRSSSCTGRTCASPRMSTRTRRSSGSRSFSSRRSCRGCSGKGCSRTRPRST